MKNGKIKMDKYRTYSIKTRKCFSGSCMTESGAANSQSFTGTIWPRGFKKEKIWRIFNMEKVWRIFWCYSIQQSENI